MEKKLKLLTNFKPKLHKIYSINTKAIKIISNILILNINNTILIYYV